MKRAWVVRPDTDEGTVSREAMIASLMDGEALLARAGGVLTVIVQREPTGFPGEMETTAAVVEWKDRTDARVQPESQAALVPTAHDDPRLDDLILPDPTPEELEERLEREAVIAAVDSDDPDAVALARLEDEDESSIPGAVR